MRVIGLPNLESLTRSYPMARKPVEKWIQVVEEANWNNWAQLKSTFRSADLVPIGEKKYVIFNVGGNKYRIVTIVNFKAMAIIIKVALIHSEYDKGKWKD